MIQNGNPLSLGFLFALCVAHAVSGFCRVVRHFHAIRAFRGESSVVVNPLASSLLTVDLH